MSGFSRREFLATSAAATVATFGTTAPAFLNQAAAAAGADERILVVVEMAGGNDGLNTVVPYAHSEYRRHRQALAIPTSEILKIDDQLGFHPSLQGFADLLEDGHLSVIQGVGYDNPNRSHFESMDIWHTCQRKDEQRVDGWLGRYLEQPSATSGMDPSALHLGSDKQPYALMSREVRTPSIRSLQQFRLESQTDQKFRMAVRELAETRRDESNDLLNFVQSSTSSAIAASERIEAAGKDYKPASPYPETGLGQKLKTVAQLISAGLQTRVYYVQIDGFDTHSQQLDAHSALLRQVSEAMSAFLKDVIAQGNGDRVLMLAFSEFGRRVQENASEGTDHGTAGPVFMAGTGLKPGFVGAHPDLNDLQDGDLKHHTDFRQVYSAVLEKWMQCRSEQILKACYDPVDVFASA